MSKFLDKKQEEKLVKAIQLAENRTSGEIRLHIEKKCPLEDTVERCKEVFTELRMHETELHNGILIYIAHKDHKVAIWGDKGIHEKVGQDFWEEELQLIIDHFRRNEYTEGLRIVIEQIGEKLKEYFPYSEHDENELSDEISYDDPAEN